MGFNNTTGSNNICVGYRQSGQNLTSGNFNCYLGERSQQKTSMDYSTWMKHKN